MEGAFGETEPDVRVQFARLLEGVGVQIEHDHLAAGPENAEGLVHGPLGLAGVVQRLAQDREVDRRVGQRHALDIP